MATSALLALLFIAVHIAKAQNCYYPNGDVESGVAQCSSDGGACCPFQWECLSNGLCFLPNQQYFGRYACTDQSWQSPDCPQLCTNGNTASGNEAILQCSDGSYCCDGDRSFDCCAIADTNYFALPSGSSIASITTVPTPTAAPYVTNSPISTSVAMSVTESSISPQTSTAQSSTPQEAPPSTSSMPSSTINPPSSTETNAHPSTTILTVQTITSDANGIAKTVTVVSVAAAPSATQSHSISKSSSHLGLIIGLAVGIPFLLAIAAFTTLNLLRRRRRRRNNNPPINRSPSEKPSLVDMYAPVSQDPNAPELDSRPIATGRTKSGRKSELPGSDAGSQRFSRHSELPGTPTFGSPAVNQGASPALSAATAPPQYSPDAREGLQAVREQRSGEGPAELWGGYVPYRPPAQTGLSDGAEGRAGRGPETES